MNQESVLTIHGMDCAEETGMIRKKLDGMDGIESLDFNIIRGTVTVTYEDDLIDEPEIRKLIEQTGLRVATGDEAVDESFWARRGKLVLTAVSGVLILAGAFTGFLVGRTDIAVPIYISGILTGGYHIFRKALASIRARAADMNLLMSIAVVGAVLIGEWLEATVVIFLFSIAGLLESFSMEKARSAIERLMDIAPDFARVRRDGNEVELTPDQVKPGDLIIIKPGERIPLDGEVETGGSFVDQSPITGESKVISKQPGDEVFAGTLNQQGYLEVRVTREVADTTLARIIHLVEEAGARRAPSQNFVDRFARYYTPAVIGLAMILAVFPPLFFQEPFTTWFYRALVLLVISCPCALVISTPVTIVSALASAARNGVLIKGGIYLEEAARVRTVVFDKTGTLTLGRLEVTDVIPLDERKREEVLAIAAAIESHSEHHLAHAIIESSRGGTCGMESPSPEVDRFEAVPGKGVRAVVDGEPYLLGSRRMIEEEGLGSPAIEELVAEYERGADTAVLLAGKNAVLGVIVISDVLRDESRKTVEELERIGVDRIVMLTGDDQGAAAAVAGELGIGYYEAGLLPHEKVKRVQDLVDESGSVTFVGDGVNDAPALATATVGMAMGSTGTAIALETSDVVLMSDDLSRIPLTIRIGKKTLRVIKENIAFALLTKFVFFVLAIPGLATLWMAVGADMGASLVVILNGMRLLRGVPERRERRSSPEAAAKIESV